MGWVCVLMFTNIWMIDLVFMATLWDSSFSKSSLVCSFFISAPGAAQREAGDG